MSTRTATLAIALIVAAGFVLRIVGIQYGLPAVYNPDEAAIMARALSFAKGTLNPENFLYPTFYFYALFGWVGAYLALLWLSGAVSSMRELQELYFTDPTGIYTAGRTLTALCGTAAVFALYRLGSRLFERRVGLVAAALLAIAPLAVRDSHYVKHDVPATLAVIVAMWAIARLWNEGPATPRVLVSGATCGVAFSTHYYCIFLALPLAWALLQRCRPEGVRQVARHALMAAGTAAVVFFALSPFILFEPATAWRDVVANRQIVIDRAVEAGAFAPAAKYASMLWRDAMSPAVVVAAAVGSAWLLARCPATAVLLLAFPLSFLLFISNTAPASRYLNPVLPFVALLAGWAVVESARRMRAPSVVLWLVVAGLCVGPLRASIAADLFFRQDDTRTLALRFIEREIPADSTLLVQPYSVPVRPSRTALIDALTRNVGSADAASTKFRLQLGLDPYPEPAYRLLWLGRGGLDAEKIYIDPAHAAGPDGLKRLRDLGVTYVILKRYSKLDPELMSLAAALERRGQRLAEFSPYRPGVSPEDRERIEPFLHNTDTRIDAALQRPGPPLEIWQIDGPDS